MEQRLKDLVNKTVFIIREARAKYKNPAILFSSGKDSTAILYLIKQALGKVDMPVIHIDTGQKFKEIYAFRDKLVKEMGLKLIVAKNDREVKKGKSGLNTDRFKCCSLLKTDPLKEIVRKNKFDALIVSIRHDEHGIRGKERYFSPRDNEFQWKTSAHKKGIEVGVESLQDAELSGWGIYATYFGEEVNHVRVHPLLHWSELDIWRYIESEEIPVNPLYFSKEGKRYRSLGCIPCTQPFSSESKSVPAIIEEIGQLTTNERSGRNQDKAEVMERLRALGYM
ncbi:MAG: sulfate adenylyltransferase subunit CysD [Candidatus Woesearchaeota archaeon]|jgi:sulfate adenylyltransferase subunit 2|nr:sulfate adenylyltransferase subunit CysD [Candidatus Woesearchaeota archaeon]MDP7457647.1 sulfate adenylyltransferase subunit CysD [Candidatus Woesearchaeota archaeon]|tara:strand:+ start:1048 stop:1890 length:843 start_codon:yes stop_codon:yes gene_type:complete